MTETTWPGKPGVPLNPGLPGAHWLKGYTEDAWMYDGDGGWWGPGYSHKLDAETVAVRYSYLGPCLTPDDATALQARVAELESLVKSAFTEGFNAGHEEGEELGEFTANGGDARRHEGRGLIWHWQSSETKAVLEGKKA